MATVAPTIAVIIAAAGTSSRMGTGIDKQFAPVGGKPLLWHSLQFLQWRQPKVSAFMNFQPKALLQHPTRLFQDR